MGGFFYFRTNLNNNYLQFGVVQYINIYYIYSIRNKQKTNTMTTLEQFKAANEKVNQIADALYVDEIGLPIYTEEYDEALEIAVPLYDELQKNGINPF